MKTIKFSMFALLCIFFISCSSDDEPVNVDSSMVTGDWIIESFNYNGESSGTFEGIDLSTTYEGVGENIDAVLSFNDDNTFDFQGNYDVRLTAEGITEVVSMDDATSSGNWSLDGDYIVTSAAIGQVQNQAVQGPSESRMRISEVSENRMVLIIDQEDTMTQGGMEFNIKTGGRYVLIK